MNDDRNSDKKVKIAPENSNKFVTKEVLKSVFIADGLTIPELAEKYNLQVRQIQKYAEEENWIELRKAYITSGLNKIQNTQIKQAQKLLDLESSFKNLKLMQLENQMKQYAAYFERYGHLFKVHPQTGELLMDTNNMPIPLKIPDISKEIRDIKESVTVGEGMRSVIAKLENLLHEGEPVAIDQADAVIELTASDYAELFEKK